MSEYLKILQSGAESLIDKIKENMIQSNITATGQTAEGLGYEIIEDGDNITLNITANQFTQVIETGRKPTPDIKPGRSMIENITQWVQARGLESSIVWAIATQIQKEGTQLWQKGGREDIYTLPFNEFVNILSQNIIGATTEDFIQTIIKSYGIKHN